MITKNYFENGDRVLVIEGEFQYQQGKVIAHVTGDFNLQKQYQIQLDNGIQAQISGCFLRDESLMLDENAEITELVGLVRQVASQLPGNRVEKLDINLKDLRESLKSKNKSRFGQQYNYILEELKIAVENRFITEESSKPIITSFEKLKYWLKNSKS